MPAATTFVRRNVNKLMAVGPAHVTSAGALKARRKSAQHPSAAAEALDTDVSSTTVLQAVRGFENDRRRAVKATPRKERKRRTASQAAHAGFARKVASLGVEETDASENEGDLGASQAELDADATEDVTPDADASPPVTLQVLIKPAKVPKRKGRMSLLATRRSLLTLFGWALQRRTSRSSPRSVLSSRWTTPHLYSRRSTSLGSTSTSRMNTNTRRRTRRSSLPLHEPHRTPRARKLSKRRSDDTMYMLILRLDLDGLHTSVYQRLAVTTSR